MKVALIGSRKLTVDISAYIPKNATEIITGGARGIDKKAEEYAGNRRLKMTVIKPDYEKYGNKAPLRRNDRIIDLADYIIAIWDGQSSGTGYVITRAREKGKPVRVIKIRQPIASPPRIDGGS